MTLSSLYASHLSLIHYLRYGILARSRPKACRRQTGKRDGGALGRPRRRTRLLCRVNNAIVTAFCDARGNHFLLVAWRAQKHFPGGPSLSHLHGSRKDFFLAISRTSCDHRLPLWERSFPSPMARWGSSAGCPRRAGTHRNHANLRCESEGDLVPHAARSHAKRLSAG